MTEKINWLLVGIGDVAATRVIPAIHAEPRSALYGVVTRDPAKGHAHSSRVWTNLNDALSDASIDAVYVATPVFLHAPQTTLALSSGKNVLCEKPMAMNYAQAEDMVCAAQRSGKTLGIAYFRRMYPKLRRALELIEAGIIGKPLLAEIQCHEWVERSEARTWLFDPEMAGGGPLFDIGSHRIDVLNWFFGRPERVRALLSPLRDAQTVERSATILIEYAGGARGVVDVRWSCREPRDTFRIIGEHGSMDLSPLNGPDLKYGGVVESLPASANRHFPCIQQFVNALLDGAPFEPTGAAAISTDWVTQTAVESAAVALHRNG